MRLYLVSAVLTLLLTLPAEEASGLTSCERCSMTIVAGVDFGTQSVRFSIFRQRARPPGLGRRALIRCCAARTIPITPPRRHADHLAALVAAAQQAIAAAGINGREIAALAIDTTGSTVVPVGREPASRSTTITCGATIAAGARRRRSREPLARRAWRRSHWCGGTYSSEFGWAKLWHWLQAQSRKALAICHGPGALRSVTAVLCGITELEPTAAQHLCDGPQVDVERIAGRIAQRRVLCGSRPGAGRRSRADAGRYARSDTIAGTSFAQNGRDELGLKAGIPIPVGALDAHWDAIGAGIRLGDIVNVIGTSTCVMAISERLTPIPGVFGVVPGSIHPRYAGIEAGLSAAGDIFEAIARRAGTTLAELSQAVEGYRSGQTGLLRMVWDHGDRTILAQPHLGGVTFGWKLGSLARPTSCSPRWKGRPFTRESSSSAWPSTACPSSA